MKIKNCEAGQKVQLVLMLSDIQIKKTNTGAEYASMIGFDGTEKIEVKMWNFDEEKKGLLLSQKGKIFVLSGSIKDYQGKLQLNVADFRLTNDLDEIDEEDFYEYAPVSIDELQSKIEEYITKIDNKVIQDIVVKLLKDNYKKYFLYPAAMSMHHNYISGLAYHSYSMLRLSDAYLKQYSYLNKNLVYAGIIIHDIGKTKELSGPKGTEYTEEGNLLGHISIGANMLYSAASTLGYENTEELLVLEHIILSHHGLNEYGSPKEPLVAEAALIYLLDFSDSRLASLEKEILSTEEGKHTNPIGAFDRKTFYVPKIK